MPDICGRLQRALASGTLLNSGVCATTLRDLTGLRAALTDQLQLLRTEEANLTDALRGGCDGLRTFWLDPADVVRASERLLPGLAKLVAQSEALLRQVLELLGALEHHDAQDRALCVSAILELISTGGGDGGAEH